tara:strand:- start:446 stop:817 length:372 start_codon:yes stop_codon:yes gene_type:complete
MYDVDINDLIDENNYLFPNVENNIIGGKVDKIIINSMYDTLNLFNVECKIIYYENQWNDSIRDHILPNSLKELYCSDNDLNFLPTLPDSLEILDCSDNKLIYLIDDYNSLSFIQLPNSLKILK